MKHYLVAAIIGALAMPTLVAAQGAKMADEAKVIDQRSLAPLSEEQLKKMQMAGDVSLCKNQQIPNGWVVIAEGSNASCPGNFPNTWTIRQPGPVESICKVSPIPAGYIIQGEASHGLCPGRFPNTWQIRRL